MNPKRNIHALTTGKLRDFHLMTLSLSSLGTLCGIFNMGLTLASIVGPIASSFIVKGRVREPLELLCISLD